MKPIWACLAAVLLLAGVAGATPACTSGPSWLTASTTLSCGGLTFSNFNVVAAAPGTNPMIAYVSADLTGPTVNLEFNPGLMGAVAPQDLHFYFQVTGVPITGVDLAVGGTSASVDEMACSAAIPTSGPMKNLCPVGTTLANMVAFSYPAQNYTSVTFGTPVNTLYIFKDIGVGMGGSLSSFTESFEIQNQTPEPASLLFIGSGLVALGWLRRRRAHKI